MSSIAYNSLYKTDEQRDKCYTCKGGGEVNIRGKETKLECRKFTETGNRVETMMSASQTDIFQKDLIEVRAIGVDTARSSWGSKYQFKTQSRGGGGLDKYDCGKDYQIAELIRHDKLYYTELLSVHSKDCLKKYIGTELQDMIYNEDYQDSYDADNMLSDVLILAARNTISMSIEYTDIIGVYAGANEDANAYDGILAQAYWAYTGLAYFHSIKFIIDEEQLVDGAFLQLKYAGCQKTIQFDSSVESDSDLETYATKEEVYSAVVDWLNEDVRTANDRKYVDAVFVNNSIIVTSKWAERTVNLSMYISSTETANWVDCDSFTGVAYETLQGAMPIDERPVLVDYRKYKSSTIVHDLSNDIENAVMHMDLDLIKAGQELTLYIDEYLWRRYKHAFKNKDANSGGADLSDDYRVETLKGLSQHGGSGIWFLSVSSSTPALRNVKHLVDVERSSLDPIYIGPTDNSCREVEILYDTLHGVAIEDLRLFASNLLCSPFAKTLKTPWEKTIKMIPCYNPKVRSSWIDPADCEKDCNIKASFCKVDEYKNAAIYSLNGTIYVLEAGEELPAGALPVYEISFKDTTKNIPLTLIETAQYEYHVVTSEGTEYTLTGKDPILQYAGTAAGTSFNITQTVTLSNGCTDTFNASDYYEVDFPFECKGECDGINIEMIGSLIEQTVNCYTSEDNVSIPTSINTDKGVIDTSSATDMQTLVDVVNAWLTTNNFTGEATFEGVIMTVCTNDAVFVDYTDGTETTVFVVSTQVNDLLLTVDDNTEFDEGDGIASILVTVTGADGVVTFDTIPENDSVIAAGLPIASIEVEFQTIFGCTFNLEYTGTEQDFDFVPVV